jgi:hypothetical protein
MKKYTYHKLFVLALCITGNLLLAQSSPSAICRLGDIKNDSIIPFVENLQIDCSEDVALFQSKSTRFKRLVQLTFSGETSADNWQSLFNKIKSINTLKTVVFDETMFDVLPVGYENLYYVENIAFENNDGLDYSLLLNQLKELKNLKTVQLEIYTIFDLPANTPLPENLNELILVNTDETNSDLFSSETEDEKKVYDFYNKKNDDNTLHVKYVSMAGAIDADEYKELSKRFTATQAYRAMSTSYEPNYKFVQPPIRGIDVTRKYYDINPEIENVLVYPSGTKILIPANAFVDAKGNPASGNVKIAYREFRDQVDIMVSGIPMKYDSAGSINDFESAGMFEIIASTNGKPLQLAEGKNIDMNFSSTSQDSTYNFYAFNDNSGNWDYLNKPQTVTAQTKITPKVYSQAYVQYRYLLTSRPKVADSLTLSQRFLSDEYLYTIRRGDRTKNMRYDYKKEGRNMSVLYSRSVKVSNVRKLKDGTLLFKLKFNTYLHPELVAFSDVYFASTENIASAEFKKKYVKGKYYNDVRVYDNGELIEIQLKESTKTTTLFAGVGRIKDNKGFVEAKDLHNKMKKYNRSLRYREKSFNKSIRRKNSKNYEVVELTDLEAIKRYAYTAAKEYMSGEEKKMSYDQWLSYYEQIIANELLAVSTSQATSSNLVQSLSISGMGIYNCDQIQRISYPIEVFASYKSSATDKKLDISTTLLIDKKKNAVFQYTGAYGYKPSKIVMSGSKNAEQILVAVKSDGGIAIYTTENFKGVNLEDKKKFEFVVNEIDSSFTTVDDLRKIIGL